MAQSVSYECSFPKSLKTFISSIFREKIRKICVSKLRHSRTNEQLDWKSGSQMKMVSTKYFFPLHWFPRIRQFRIVFSFYSIFVFFQFFLQTLIFETKHTFFNSQLVVRKYSNATNQSSVSTPLVNSTLLKLHVDMNPFYSGNPISLTQFCIKLRSFVILI